MTTIVLFFFGFNTIIISVGVVIVKHILYLEKYHCSYPPYFCACDVGLILYYSSLMEIIWLFHKLYE
jgi:hypothetical protein